MRCPQCQSQYGAADRYCDACGTILGLACGACGHINRAAARFCGNCRNALSQAASPASDAVAKPPTGAPAAERKQVTILFADLVNSTGLIQALDPEHAVDLLKPALDAMTTSVHRYGGVVNKLLGDGVMALFGAPNGQEDHAIRASLAALAVREAFVPLGAAGLQVRMGLHSGEVVTGTTTNDISFTYDVSGRTVHLASRIEHVEDGPGIFMTGNTYRAARTFIEARSIGMTAIRGFAEPIEVFRLLGMKRAAASLQFRGRNYLSRFVGREPEIGLLERALEDTGTGDVRVVGVAAEPGVGKSRLCYEFAERCRARSIPVYEARALAFGQATPFEMVLEFLRDFLRIDPGDKADAARDKVTRRLRTLDASLAPDAPLLADFLGVGDPKQPLPRMDPVARRSKMLDLTRRIVRIAGRERPSLIVLEDLHWMDGASAAFVDTLVEALPGTKVMLMVNFRPSFRAGWMDRSYYEQMPLFPLRGRAAEVMLRETLGEHPSMAALAQRIGERAQGNPFFMEELARALFETGALSGERGAYVLAGKVDDIAIPDTVQSLIGARIDRLPEADKALLQTAGVIGKEFSLGILKAVDARPEGELLASLARLIAGELVMEFVTIGEPRFAFRHPLIQEVAYLSQVMPRRRFLHGAVARAIEAAERDRGDEHAGLIAHHREHAGETLQAVMDWTRAAVWTGTSDSGQALSYWKKIRTLLHTQPKSMPTDRLRMMAAGQVVNFGWRQGITAEEAKEYFEEASGLALEAGDQRAQTLILAAYGRIIAASGGADEYVARVEEALAMIHDARDVSLRVTLNSVLCHALRMAGRLNDALAANDRAMQQIDQVGRFDLQMLGFNLKHWLLGLRAQTLTLLGRGEEARGLLDRLLQSEEHALDTLHRVMAHATYVELARIESDGAVAQRHARIADDLAQASSSPYLRVYSLGCLGLAALTANDCEQAVTDFTAGLRLAKEQRLGMENEPRLLAELALALSHLGDHTATMETAQKAISVARRRNARISECQAQIVYSMILSFMVIDDSNTMSKISHQRAIELLYETNAASLKIIFPQLSGTSPGIAQQHSQMISQTR